MSPVQAGYILYHRHRNNGALQTEVEEEDRR